MKALSRYLFYLLGILSFSLSSQDYEYRTYKHEWDVKKPVIPTYDTSLDRFHAVILKDNSEIRITKKKTEVKNLYYYFPDEIVFKVHKLIRIADSQGLRYNSNLILPESYDPERDFLEYPYDSYEIRKPPYLFDAKILKFAARVIRDGMVMDVKCRDKARIKYVRSVRDEWLNFISYEFSLDGLKVGDVLEILYEYSFPFLRYQMDASERIFLADFSPRVSYELKFSYPVKDLLLYQFNNAQPASDTTVNHIRYLTYSGTNAYGFGYNPGVRLHQVNPFLFFQYYNKEVYNPLLSPPKPQEGEGPYFDPSFLVNFMERTIKRTTIDKYYTKSEDLLQKYYEKTVKDIPDTQYVAKALALHADIVKSFDFYGQDRIVDENYIHDNLGEQVSNKRITYRLVDSLYRTLLRRSGHPKIFRGVVPDKRWELFDPGIMRPYSGRFIYGVGKGKSMFLLLPKFSRTGFYVDELPFYYEDVHVPYYWKPDALPGESTKIEFKIRKSPFSDEQSNIRTYSCVMQVKLDSQQTHCDGRLSLSGQFSTMTRGLYLYNDTDSSLSHYYRRKIWNLKKGTELKKQELSSSSENFPFKHGFRFKYLVHDQLDVAGSKAYDLDLSNMFNHLIHDGFSYALRTLPYYPDFLSTDKLQYQIVFDRPVIIEGLDAWNREMTMGAGSYQLKMNMPDDRTLFIESTLIVRDKEFKPQDTKSVQDVYDLIRKLNKAKIRVVEKG